ncbi:unnamed protein product [Blepharisma stoltei]|uniref:PUM-HD domain-containing protein n=1 Tax=Blepharisma stoltei TaxID=1481888 RepID=A0AAU9JV79_9CILI|nr:unnamed protein product [Blepharisma stoltei]
MIVQHGNSMCQTLFQCCSPWQRLILFYAMKDDFISISNNLQGCFPLQRILRLASLPEEVAIYEEAFKGHILELSMTKNSSLVIKVLCERENHHFIITEIIGHARELATNKFGYVIMKKCVKDSQIFNELLEQAIMLIEDKYGNYVIQHMIDNMQEECSLSIINCIKGKALELCIQEYSSNVMNKCMKEERMRCAIINELIRGGSMQTVLENPYGCYVLRTAALEAETGTEREGLKRAILVAIPQIREKNNSAWWEEIISYLNAPKSVN